MASLVIPTATLTLLLFLLISAPTIVTSIVVDIDGNIVENGIGEYTMLPYPQLEGGGPIGWVSKTNTCPVDVTRTAFTEHSPPPSTITLTSPYLSNFIPEGPIFIKFNDKDTPCDNKPLWWFIKPKVGIFVFFLELGAGTDDPPSFELKIEDANIEGKHVYQLKYCESTGGGCTYIVDKPDNSGLLGIVYDLPNLLKPFQFQLAKADSSLKKRM